MPPVKSPLVPTGAALFEAHFEVIQRVISFVCSRHHLASSDTDDFASHVALKLIEDDYSILSKFQGRSSLRTFLTIVVQRLFLDYRNTMWGKWRPSAEARRSGHVAMLLERLTARDGYSFEEACELLITNHGVAVDRVELERLAGRLPVRVKRRFEADDALAEIATSDAPIDDVVAARARAASDARIQEALQSAMAGLPPQDRLILALRFEDGRSVAEIAGTLRIDQKRLYRRVARLLTTLRIALEAQQIDSRSVREMIESPAVSMDWSDEGGESVTASPSREPGERRGIGL